MAKNILIIATSPRKNGNSSQIAQEFAKGASDAGNNCEIIYLADKNINFCKGCLVCQKTKKCVIHDDAPEIVEKMKTSDVIVWATPVYYYEMCGQMKTMIDRANSLFADDYSFRDIYLIATAADSGDYSADGTIKGLSGWIECMDKTNLKGVIKGFGLEQPDDIKSHPEILKEAYNAGQNV